MLKVIYTSLVQSILEYGIIAWGAAYPTNLRNVEVIQRSIIKIILHKPRDYPSIQLFKDFDVLNIKQLFHLNVFIYYNNKPKNFCDHNYPTRNNSRKQLRYVRCKTKSVQFQGNSIYPIIYNELPPRIRDIRNSKRLRKALQMWMINKTWCWSRY